MRVAIMVDAGYFFAAASALISESGQKRRNELTLDEKATVAALKTHAGALTGLQVLRIYWYDGAGRTGPSAEHSRIANCDDMKLRLGFLNSAGQQKGVDSLIVTDLVELARNHAISDVLLISGDEDVRIGVQLAQSFGVRVHLLGIEPCRGSQSLQLRQEADTCSEWGKNDVAKLLKIREDLPTRTTDTSAEGNPDIGNTIRGVVKAIIDGLEPREIEGINQFMSANRQNLPREYDGKLLAKMRSLLSRDLEPREKSMARRQFREYLGSLNKKKAKAADKIA